MNEDDVKVGARVRCVVPDSPLLGLKGWISGVTRRFKDQVATKFEVTMDSDPLVYKIMSCKLSEFELEGATPRSLTCPCGIDRSRCEYHR